MIKIDYQGPHPNLSPELNRQLREVAEKCETAQRLVVGWMPCEKSTPEWGRNQHAGGRALLYFGDPRARGWLRWECKCGDWGDRVPSKAQIDRAAKLGAELSDIVEARTILRQLPQRRKP